jgi:FMN reductase
MASLIALNGSPSSSSRTAAIANTAVELNGNGKVIHLGDLDAGALLARGSADDVSAALAAVRAADVLVVASPVYRRTYSGLLKAFFDLFEPAALAGIPAIIAVTAGQDQESLCIDHGLRPLLASLDAWSVPTAVYAVHADFENGQPVDSVRARVAQALAEAALVERIRTLI